MEKLDLPGFRMRKSGQRNEVYIRDTPFDCMTELIMPAMMRDAKPEVAVDYVLGKLRDMYGQDIDALSPSMRSDLTPLQYSILLAHSDVREALVDQDKDMMRRLTESYRRGDFVSINHGVISSERFMEALRKSDGGRIPVAWYQNELRNDVNGLGAAVHMEIPLLENSIGGTPLGRGLYPATSPIAREFLHQRGNYLFTLFHEEENVALLSPLSFEQYASDGLACLSGEYSSRSQSTPAMDPMSRMLSQFLGFDFMATPSASRQDLPSLPPELLELLRPETPDLSEGTTLGPLVIEIRIRRR